MYSMYRRKIRLIDGNVKCRHLKKLTSYTWAPIRDRQRGVTACPACWAMGTNESKIKIVGGFCTGLTTQPRQNKNLLYWHDELKKQKRAGPLSYVLLASPFTSVTTGATPFWCLWLSPQGIVFYCQDLPVLNSYSTKSWACAGDQLKALPMATNAYTAKKG